MKIVEAPVRNHSARPPGAEINCVVLHDTQTLNVAGVIAWFNDPSSQVSAHYTIDRDGTIYRHVDEARKAWHAGRSSLWGMDDLNVDSVGIELVDADDREPYPDAQLGALVDLTEDLCRRHPIPLNRIIGHQHVAPGRKPDPGADFDWRGFLIVVGARLAERFMPAVAPQPTTAHAGPRIAGTFAFGLLAALGALW